MLSCNDCGAVGWTDGYFIAMMWPDQPELVKCPHCKAILWIDDQEMVGEKEGWCPFFDKNADSAGKMDFSCAVPYLKLNRADYFKVIGQGGLDDERLRHVRNRAWHCGNHVRRTCTQDRSLFRRKANWQPAPMSARERANLEALLSLLDEGNDEDRILKAEACRELGRFDDALRLLNGPIEEDFKAIADIIRELATKHDAIVKEIIREDG